MPCVDKLYKVVCARPYCLLLLTSCSAQTARYMQNSKQARCHPKAYKWRHNDCYAQLRTSDESIQRVQIPKVWRPPQCTFTVFYSRFVEEVPVSGLQGTSSFCVAGSAGSKSVNAHHECLPPSAGSLGLLDCRQTFKAKSPALMADRSGACKHLDSPGQKVDLILAWTQVSLSSRTRSECQLHCVQTLPDRYNKLFTTLYASSYKRETNHAKRALDKPDLLVILPRRASCLMSLLAVSGVIPWRGAFIIAHLKIASEFMIFIYTFLGYSDLREASIVRPKYWVLD